MSLTVGHELFGAPELAEGQPLSAHEARKFLFRTVAPAIIQPQEAEMLIDYTIDQSVLLREMTLVPMDTNELEIRFIALSGGILRLAVCNSGCGESVSISNTNKCLKTTSLDVKFFLCDDDIQDGLTGAQIEQQLIRMTGDQLNNELELFGIMGNTNGSYFATAAPPSPAVVNDAVMQSRDNLYRQLQQGHIVNAQSLADGGLGVGAISHHALNCLQRALPSKFRTNPERRRIYMAPDLWQDYAELLQGRQTDLGDRAILGPPINSHQEVPIVQVPMIPTNIQRCGCQSLPSANGTFAFTTVPSNLIFGVEKNVTFERWRDGCNHLTWFIWTVRVDFLVYNEDATALLDCVTLSNCGSSCGVVPLPAGRCFSCIGTGS